ncbi:MAG TPA: 2-dehydropantoate 2-reductase [Gaiellaceae bacterium]
MRARPITVFGAGAIGGFVGGRLAAAGEDVVLVDVDADHVRAIRERGLRITGALELQVSPPACLPSEVEGPLETVLLAVKARHTEDALERIAPLLAPSGCVVSLQNGLEELRIARRVGPERTVGAFLTFGGHYAGPGEIVFGGEGSFRIGELDGSSGPRLDELARRLGQAHPVETTDRIFGFLWGKVAVEAFYFASALTDTDVVDLLDRVEALAALGALVTEVALVAEAEGARCEPVDGFDANALASPGSEAARASWQAHRRHWEGHVAGRTGIWRDLAVHHRPTEVDAVLGPVVAAAARHGIPTPRLVRLVELVHDAEAGRLPLGLPTLSALAVAA